MARLFEDTHPDVEARLLDGLRAMSPEQRLERVFSLRRATVNLAVARVMDETGVSHREALLRVAEGWIPAALMARVRERLAHEPG